MGWPHLPIHLHQERDMLEARLKALERALSQIIDLADSHENAEEALIQIATIADKALKL